MIKKDNLSPIDHLKVWIIPTLFSVLGMFIWRDLNEVRSDVKLLLKQSTEDHMKIIELDADVNKLKERVFYKSGSPTVLNNNPVHPMDRLYAIKEEEFTVKN